MVASASRAALESRGRRASPRPLIQWLLVCSAALWAGPARCTSAAAGGAGCGFNVFGERCAGEGCLFDATPVGGDIGAFCLSGAAGGGRPVQLVRPLANHSGVELVEEGVQLLRSLPKPLAVVAVIGSIKTGKSFFLNALNEHVLCGEGERLSGFQVNDGVPTTTRGIWMWSEPIEVECRALKEHLGAKPAERSLFEHIVTVVDSLLGGRLKATLTVQRPIAMRACEVDRVRVVLLDVEGFNSTDGLQRYDEALFTIASALSTELVYLTHKVVDSRDLVDLQHMLQMSNSTLINIHRSLSNAPRVFVPDGPVGSPGSAGADGVSVTPGPAEAAGPVGPSHGDPDDADAAATAEGTGGYARQAPLDLQRDATLTISVQGFNLQLQQSALDYINGVINGKRFDLSYSDHVSFFEYIGRLRSKLLSFFSDGASRDDGSGSPEKLVNDVLSRLTSNHKYGIPHMFASIDVFLTSAPAKQTCADVPKAELLRGYLAQMLKYKSRLFRRSLLHPKQRFSTVLDGMTYMAGEDLGDLLAHLVGTLNDSMRSGSADYLGDFRVTRANLVKNDLVDLFAGELWGFVHQQSIPLDSDLEDFNRVVENKYTQLFDLYARYDLSEQQYESVRQDFAHRLRKTLAHLEKRLYQLTLEYCRSKVPGVKNGIRERIALFHLPVPPAVIEKFEGEKRLLMDLFDAAVDKGGAKYSGTAACKEVSAEVSVFVDDSIRQLHADNDSEIGMKFQEGTRRAVEFFVASADRNSAEKYRVPYSAFVDSLSSWVGGAYSEFYDELGEFRDVAKFREDAVHFLGKQMSLFEKEARDHWHDVCREAATRISHEFKKTFETKLKKLVPHRPTPPRVLLLAVAYMRLRGVRDLSALYCSDSQVVRDAQHSFDRAVDESRRVAVAANYEAIFRHFDREFGALQREATERVERVYHFYQLKRHIHQYAEKRMFARAKAFDQLLRPQRAVDEFRRQLDAKVLEEVPANAARLRELRLVADAKDGSALEALGLDPNSLATDVVEHWLEERLYPRIRSHLRLRMPRLSTVCALAVGSVSTAMVLTVSDPRLLYFLLTLAALSAVHLVGPRRALWALSALVLWTWRLAALCASSLGVAWTAALCASIFTAALLWYVLSRRLPAALAGRHPAKYLVVKES